MHPLFLFQEGAMLIIKTKPQELYDEIENRFITKESKEYRLEHSLKSISKWEAKYEKPFLDPHAKPQAEEMLDYYSMMCIDGPFDPTDLSIEELEVINNYIISPQTATKIKSSKESGVKKVVTSEVIYAMMTEANIPFECEEWNINRLLILLNVIDARRNPKKMSVTDVYRENTRLNQLRKQRLNTRG